MVRTASISIVLLLYPALAEAGGGIKNVRSAYLNGQTVSSEPGPFKMNFGDMLYVDDRSCPSGQMKQVMAPISRGQPRTRQCVVH